MGLLGATLLVVMLVVVTEAQVRFPSNALGFDECIASNGRTGSCFEFRSRHFKECTFFPSMDTSNPNVARHLTDNICRNTGRELYICCPSPPKRRDPCSTIRCQSNAQCFPASGNKPTKCYCDRGYRSYQDMCIATCNVMSCQENALCVEGSRAAASVCLCKKGYRLNNGRCLSTCDTTKCPKNARCLEGSGDTSTSCKCKNGYKSTRTACIELKPRTPVTQDSFNTQAFGGSSALQSQGNSWNQFSQNRNQYFNPNQQRQYNPFG